MTLPYVSQKNHVLLEYGKTIDVNHVMVQAIPSYHCDGSCMFFFAVSEATILYTGDYRFHDNLKKNPLLSHMIIDRLYYDNTFDNQSEPFPSYTDTFEQLEKALYEVRTHDHVYIHVSVIGFESILRVYAQQHNVRYSLSSTLIEKDPVRSRQLVYLLGSHLETNEDNLPTKIVLSNYKLNDSEARKYTWIVPTTTYFLCDIVPLSKEFHAKYIWFSTHTNHHENQQFRLFTGARKVIACSPSPNTLKCQT